MDPRDLITKETTVSNIKKSRGYHGEPGKPHLGLPGIWGGSRPRNSARASGRLLRGVKGVFMPSIVKSVVGLLLLGGGIALAELTRRSATRDLVDDVRPTDSPDMIAKKVSKKVKKVPREKKVVLDVEVEKAKKDILSARGQKNLREALTAKEWDEYIGRLQEVTDVEGEEQLRTFRSKLGEPPEPYFPPYGEISSGEEEEEEPYYGGGR